jgi:oxepin-CoA hydrolase/3-oxo-5,6-dehydrosuberyl-CoA semialdehyde dehydrogenase
MSHTLQSHIAGRWIGSQAAAALRSAINGHTVAHTHAEAIDFAEACTMPAAWACPTC